MIQPWKDDVITLSNVLQKTSHKNPKNKKDKKIIKKKLVACIKSILRETFKGC